MNENQFGKWLRKWRKARRLTQVQLAAEIDYTDAYVSALERGIKHDTGAGIRPSEDFCEKAATALGRPVEEARVLAGYHASPAPVTLREVQQMLDESPKSAFAVSPSGKYALVPLELVQQLAGILNELNSHVKDSENSN